MIEPLLFSFLLCLSVLINPDQAGVAVGFGCVLGHYSNLKLFISVMTFFFWGWGGVLIPSLKISGQYFETDALPYSFLLAFCDSLSCLWNKKMYAEPSSICKL